MILIGHELIVMRQQWRADSFAFHLLQHHPEKGRQIAAPVHWQPLPEHFSEPTPLFTLGEDRAQQLIDALWDQGLRPTRGRQSEGVTAAQARHLEDMRAIAFDRLKIERP